MRTIINISAIIVSGKKTPVMNKMPTLTFWFFVLIGGFFRTACKASMRFPVHGGVKDPHTAQQSCTLTTALMIMTVNTSNIVLRRSCCTTTYCH